MSGSASRINAINAVTNFESAPAPLNFAETSAGELFGCNVFSQKVMKDRLPKSIYKSVLKTIEMGEPLAADVADTVAAAMKDWAIEKGASHYAHVFPSAHRIDRRKARQLPQPGRCGWRGR